MKIKTWLMLSYLIVMILPLLAGYLLYQWISAYDQQRDFTDYLQVSSQMSAMEEVLQDPRLYQFPFRETEQLHSLGSETVQIKLFTAGGVQLYSSLPGTPASYVQISKERLYANLYDLQKGHRAYVLKKPVFEDEELVGFYEITMAREEWLAGIQNRTWWVGGFLAFVFLLTFLTVVILLNRKLNRPLQQLMSAMHNFARGKPDEQLSHRSKDEMQELITGFEQMRTQIHKNRLEIEKQQQQKEYMISAISHDLKTPLTSIRIYAESLSPDYGLDGKKQREYVDTIVSKTDYMRYMLDDLLTYSLLSSPDYSPERVEVEAEELFDMLLSGYDELCRKENIVLYKEQDVYGLVKVHVNQMVRVVDNMMGNALRHTKEGDRIWLAALSAQQPLPGWIFTDFRDDLEQWCTEGVLLLVQNEGDPIPSVELEQIFEPFYQADQARNQGERRGTGLGLSIAKMVIEKHEGQIKIWTGTRGTLVACRLPEVFPSDPPKHI